MAFTAFVGTGGDGGSAGRGDLVGDLIGAPVVAGVVPYHAHLRGGKALGDRSPMPPDPVTMATRGPRDVETGMSSSVGHVRPLAVRVVVVPLFACSAGLEMIRPQA
jgi:hypothetical protein